MTKHKRPRGDTRRRTKIVATLGPVSNDAESIEKLIGAGMNIVRINCSHGDHERHAHTIRNVREVAARLEVHIPIMLDLSGPKMRIRHFQQGSVVLRAGDPFTLTASDIVGDQKRVSINYPQLIRDLSRGDRILMGDGEVELRVVKATDEDAECETVIGGELKSNKGINAPGVKLRETVPTKGDIADIEFGIEKGVDWFALSFVRSAKEVRHMKELIAKRGSTIPVISKIEKVEALDNLEDILQATDAIMIARGDLGLDIPIQKVPLIQKDLISRAIQAAKPVITATQMLESMIEHPRPTRAEVADIANAVFDGTDAVMLSAETASGRYPVEAVSTMASVVLETESHYDYGRKFPEVHRSPGHHTAARAVARAACETAQETGARVIVCVTRSGQSALYVSNYRPNAKVAVVSPSEDTLNRSMLFFNTHPIKAVVAENTDEVIDGACKAVLESELAGPGDFVVIVAGVPVDVPGTTNLINVARL